MKRIILGSTTIKRKITSAFLLLCLVPLALSACDTFLAYRVKAHNTLDKPVELYSGFRRVELLPGASTTDLPEGTFVRAGWGWEFKISDGLAVPVRAFNCGRLVYGRLYSWRELEKGKILIGNSPDGMDAYFAPRHIPAQLQDVCNQLMPGSYEEALTSLENIKTEEPALRDEITFLRGFAYLRLEEYDKAVDILEPYAANNPDDIDASLHLITGSILRGYELQHIEKKPFKEIRFNYKKKKCRKIMLERTKREGHASWRWIRTYDEAYCLSINWIDSVSARQKDNPALIRYLEFFRDAVTHNRIVYMY